MARGYQLDRSVVTKIEGRISDVRERLAANGGDAALIQRPIDFVADAAGVSRSTVQRWIRESRGAERSSGRRPRELLLRDFLHAFDALCRVSVQPIERSMLAIAGDAKHPRCVEAAKWLAPRLDPIGEGPSEAEHPEREATIANVPQEVFDELTDAELARMDQMSAAMAELNREYLGVLASAARRIGAGLDAIDRLGSLSADA